MRFLFVFLLIGFFACGQQETKKTKINPEAKRLNDSAIQIMMNTGDYQKGIMLLDQAIKIDSNYFIAFQNKSIFQIQLKQYSAALETEKNLERIKPGAPDVYFFIGALYEKIGDSLFSQKYFTNALTQYDKILDTMSEKNRYYLGFAINKAVSLIMLKQEAKGNELLKALYEKPLWTGEFEETYKKLLTPFMNKSRKEIIENLFNPQTFETVTPNRIP